MNSKYTDLSAVMQVIGCVFKNPNLLDFTDKYIITDEDFTVNVSLGHMNYLSQCLQFK